MSQERSSAILFSLILCRKVLKEPIATSTAQATVQPNGWLYSSCGCGRGDCPQQVIN